jgi:hypothetical protein
MEDSYKLPFRFTGKIAELSCDCEFRAARNCESLK